MAVVQLQGFETDYAEGISTGTAAVVTTNPHSGSYCLRCNPAATSAYVSVSAISGIVPMSVRFYMRIAALPNANSTLIYTGSVANRPGLILNSTGTLSVTNNAVVQATSASSFTADNRWHRIEFDTNWNAGAGMRVFVDGVSWVSFTTQTMVPGAAIIGLWDTCTADVFFDDIIWEDATLGGARTYDWQMAYLVPVSDNTRGGNWYCGSSVTTNLYDALNNVPPSGWTFGVRTATTQVYNNTSDTTGNLDINITDYLTGGLGAGDTINTVQAVGCDGESAGTASFFGFIGLVSNPADAGFQFTLPGVVAGTFPTSWYNHVGPATSSPTVTKGTNPVLRLGKRVASATALMFCSAGIYVDYTHAAPPRLQYDIAQSVQRSAVM